jgi:hypothetical protein
MEKLRRLCDDLPQTSWLSRELPGYAGAERERVEIEALMEFSHYQLDRIARFASASDSLHQNHLLLLTPGMIKPTLVMAMRAKKTPEISEPRLQKAIEAFTQLLAHSERAKRINRLIPVALVLGAICGAFVWGRVGPAMAIVVIAAILVAAVLIKLCYGYFALRPIMRQFQLTYDETVFALNEVIADPRWRADLQDSRH